jgi:polar amino acid transport system ATP-binding protein
MAMKTDFGADGEIHIEGLWCQRGSRSVLEGVDLRASRGETVALIGPSGGGKSSLLRCLNGLNSFQRGAIRIGGDPLLPHGKTPNGVLKRVRTRLGMIFQDYRLFPHLNVLANVMEGPLSVLGSTVHEARVLAEKLLDRVGLGQFAKARPESLSGGQQQRVAIARALAMKPIGLLCDEITAALDPQLKGEVLSLLEDLRCDGLALLMVTHEIGFARRAADKVVILDGGKIIEEGTAEEVLDRPRSERSRDFLKKVMA